jgi:hypothetical protein
MTVEIIGTKKRFIEKRKIEVIEDSEDDSNYDE